jgi:CubicO group peptidase (beta-lactamase class C family)
MNRTRCAVLPAAALLAVISLHAQPQGIDEFVKGWIEKQHVPAAAIAVIKDGTAIKLEGCGLADVENRVPARADTVFKIGSLSKQFVAAAIMLLVQDGKLTVDDKVSKYLQGTPQTWDAITLRHLLTHTAGLVREGPGFDFNKLQPDLAVIETGYSVPLAFATGEKYEYSNLGYFVLAEVIQKVSGKPWGEFLAERVFTPLGMSATRVTSVTAIIPNRARGYAWQSGALRNEDDFPMCHS